MNARSSTLRLWFRPALLGLHVLAVVALAACVAGGLWQLGAYDARQEHERADRQDVPTVPLDEVWSPGDPFDATLNHRPVTVAGTFGPAPEQVWVSGRSQDGQDGYWLLAPLELSGDDALLVVRGFSPETGAPPAVPDGEVELHVVLEPGEGSSGGVGADRVIDTVRVPTLVNELPYQLFPGFGISTTPEVAAGLPRAVTPDPDVSWTVGLRNLAYSLQWWVFGAFAAFMWWRICREQVADMQARERGDADAGQDDQERLASLSP